MRKVVSIPLREGLFEFRGRDLVIFLILKLTYLLLFLFPIIYVGYVLIHYWNDVKNIALEINTLGNLVLALLTTVLVFITGFYAWVNHRMLAQMTETRQAEVRPTLWITLDKTEYGKYEYSDNRYFKIQAHVANYGKGAAVNIHIDYEIPHHWNEERKRDERIHTRRRDGIPILLSPNDVFDNSVELSTKIFDLDKVYHAYLNLTVIYEDTERTLYEMKQSYYLYPNHLSNKVISYHLFLESESLHFVPFNRRTSTTDIDESVSDEGILVFNRKLPWRLD